MSTKLRVLVVLLVVSVCLTASHPLEAEEESLPQSLEEVGVSVESGEHLATTQSHLELEDPEGASAELEDEDHALRRRKRATGQNELTNTSETTEADKLARRKISAFMECELRTDDYTHNMVYTRPPPGGHRLPKKRCNEFCCYPETRPS